MIHRMEDGTTFHSPAKKDCGLFDSLEWMLRHNQYHIGPTEMMEAASILASFESLIMMSQRKRNKIMSQMKRDIFESLRRRDVDETSCTRKKQVSMSDVQNCS